MIFSKRLIKEGSSNAVENLVFTVLIEALEEHNFTSDNYVGFLENISQLAQQVADLGAVRSYKEFKEEIIEFVSESQTPSELDKALRDYEEKLEKIIVRQRVFLNKINLSIQRQVNENRDSVEYFRDFPASQVKYLAEKDQKRLLAVQAFVSTSEREIKSPYRSIDTPENLYIGLFQHSNWPQLLRRSLEVAETKSIQTVEKPLAKVKASLKIEEGVYVYSFVSDVDATSVKTVLSNFTLDQIESKKLSYDSYFVKVCYKLFNGSKVLVKKLSSGYNSQSQNQSFLDSDKSHYRYSSMYRLSIRSEKARIALVPIDEKFEVYTQEGSKWVRDHKKEKSIRATQANFFVLGISDHIEKTKMVQIPYFQP